MISFFDSGANPPLHSKAQYKKRSWCDVVACVGSSLLKLHSTSCIFTIHYALILSLVDVGTVHISKAMKKETPKSLLSHSTQ